MLVDEVPLGPRVDAWFTGRDADGGGNLAHRRPHRPGDLARARDAVGRATRTAPARWHLMQQVHGAQVGVVTAATPVGAELRGVDALVTCEADRPLAVQVADCVPILVAGERAVAAIHAGRVGVQEGIVAAAIEVIVEAGEHAGDLRALIGPAIGGCCYEVPADLQQRVAATSSGVATTTTWGTPSLDLPAAVTQQLSRAGVPAIERSGGCTRCDPAGRWFSHRADARSGRQIGLVVRREAPTEAARELGG